MFGLQKQRRNAAGGGAWFIAGHLTVFAKLSHHAVPLESRIFSSRCFSFSVPPPSCLTLLSPLPRFCRLPHLLLSLSLVPICLLALPPDEGGTLATCRRIFRGFSSCGSRERIFEFHTRYSIKNVDQIFLPETTVTVEEREMQISYF